MTPLTPAAAAALLCLAGAGSAQAFTYDETTDPDLSGDRLAPTVLTAAGGLNTLLMRSTTGDRDYFSFAVPAGWELVSIFHQTYVSADNLSFFALQAGTTLTEPPTGTNPNNLLGWMHFGTSTANSELIDDLGTSTPAIGFTPPLSAGDYTFWVQQTGVSATYSFDFVLTAVPEPAPLALMLVGAGVLGLARRPHGRG
ncbi:MAG: PEP-CTERM sorting domain-containing protein [Rubrivivax sp.]|nr:PEP-CTERM sorting domain-containing protein [Rubrivivax sp.]